jgi:hypothetical protein
LNSRSFALSDIVSNLELFVFVVIVVFLSVVLFPWNLKEKILEEENINTDLLISYLQALEKVSDDPLIHLKLAIELAKKGELDRALKEMNTINFDLIPDNLKDRALFLSFKLYETLFFSCKSQEKKFLIRKRIEDLIILSLQRYKDNPQKLLYLYKFSEKMYFPEESLKIALLLSRFNSNWKIKAFIKAVEIGKIDLAYSILKEISIKKLPDRYKVVAFQIAFSKKDYSLAIAYLEANPTLMRKYWKTLLFLYFKTKNTKKFNRFVKQVLEGNENLRMKQEVLKLAIEHALWNSDYEKVKVLIRRYGLQLAKTPEFIKFLLKSALATGDSSFVDWLSRKIFSKVERC